MIAIKNDDTLTIWKGDGSTGNTVLDTSGSTYKYNPDILNLGTDIKNYDFISGYQLQRNNILWGTLLRSSGGISNTF